MKTKIKQEIYQNVLEKKLPLGYIFSKAPRTIKKHIKFSESQLHNTTVFHVGYFYKPISLVLRTHEN